ncbi:DUF6538 domain-containing protein [Methylobacterium sp. CM6241]
MSLRTKDVAEAKRRHSEADAELKRYWETVRIGPQPLTHREVTALTGQMYAAGMQCLGDDRSRYLLRVVGEADRVGSDLKTDHITFETLRDAFLSTLEEAGTPAEWATFDDLRAIPMVTLELRPTTLGRDTSLSLCLPRSVSPNRHPLRRRAL